GELVATKSYLGAISRRRKYAFLRRWALSNNIEAVVIRFDHLDGIFCAFAEALRSVGVVVAVELPTFPFERERDLRHKKLLQSHRYVQYAARRIFAHLENRRIRDAEAYLDFVISYLEDDEIWGVKNITADNGIDLAEIPLKKPRKADGSVRLLCVAKFAPHHGIDRLIRGLHNYEGERDVTLTLAGRGAESTELERLVSELLLTDRVTFAGVIVGDGLDSLFDQSDIAIGSLGLHRIGISLSSTMKSREYCARGIPFAYSFPEKGFSGDEDFTLLLPTHEDPIDVASIVDFYDVAAADAETSRRMREFAAERFDWQVQMGAVFDALENAVRERADA
ncbi:MAG TPA: glycosyltransferase, partial [Polyangiaceae bacterium]|nr:glycosyltransferase [Polyangiaceae bacterium]